MNRSLNISVVCGVHLSSRIIAFLAVLLLIGLRPSPVAAVAGPENEKARTRLEELFIWKTSEELKLPPEQEQKFSEIVHALGARKRKASERMEKAVAALDAAKGKPAADKALAQVRETLTEYNSIQLAEFDQLKSLIGSEKLARYYVVKGALSDKLKAMLSAPSQGGGGAAGGSSSPSTSK
jgi:hypothetical protein